MKVLTVYHCDIIIELVVIIINNSKEIHKDGMATATTAEMENRVVIGMDGSEHSDYAFKCKYTFT